MAKRKAHVKRIFKLDENNNPIEDVWIDVLRLDGVAISLSSTDDGRRGVVTNYVFNWRDETEENANPNRTTRKLKIPNPESPDDDSQTNELWIIDRTRIKMPQGADTGIQGQVVQFVFNNKTLRDQEPRGNREFTVLKIVNNDLKDMKMKTDDGIPILVDWDTYMQALQDGSKDDSQHLDVEATDTFRINFQSTGDGKRGQIIKYVLAGNKEVEQLFDLGNPDAVDANENPCVVRTDPLQLIVNVGTVIEYFLACGHFSGGPIIQQSVDGSRWKNSGQIEGTPGQTINALAYGSGVWVAAKSATEGDSTSLWRSTDKAKTWKLAQALKDFPPADQVFRLAYGRGKNPAGKVVGMFIAITRFKIYKSLDAGKTWTTLDSVPFNNSTDEFTSLDYCNGQFFIGISTTAEGSQPFPYAIRASLLVSKDAASWSKRPIFGDLSGAGIIVTGPIGGEITFVRSISVKVLGVAYAKKLKRYAAYAIWNLAFGQGGQVALAHSIDGTGWSSQQFGDYTQPPPFGVDPTTAFSHYLATISKPGITASDTEFAAPMFFVTANGTTLLEDKLIVARSTNGSSWSLVTIDTPPVNPDFGSTGGIGGVRYARTPKLFALATVKRQFGGAGSTQVSFWSSETAASWTRHDAAGWAGDASGIAAVTIQDIAVGVIPIPKKTDQ